MVVGRLVVRRLVFGGVVVRRLASRRLVSWRFVAIAAVDVRSDSILKTTIAGIILGPILTDDRRYRILCGKNDIIKKG